MSEIIFTISDKENYENKLREIEKSIIEEFEMFDNWTQKYEYLIDISKELPKMDRAPFPGEKGEELLSNVSKQAWMEWLQHQTMLVNEKQLDLSKKESRDYLSQQLENFLNNESFDKADGFIPLDK